MVPFEIIEIEAFLFQVWSQHDGGYVCLAARSADGKWAEQCFDADTEATEIRQFLLDHPAQQFDLYYCPNAFSRRRRLAKYALPTPFAWCDIDGADPALFQPPPTVLVKTSPGRHQGLWYLDRRVTPAHAETLSRQLAYGFGGDRNGWSVTKLLRLPGTINHKAAYDRPAVEIVSCADHFVAIWAEADAPTPATESIETDPARYDWREVLQRYRKKLKGQHYYLCRHNAVVSPDRSRCIFMIVAALHKAGASPDEIASVVWRSPYFISKHEYERDLRKRLDEEISRIVGKVGGGQ